MNTSSSVVYETPTSDINFDKDNTFLSYYDPFWFPFYKSMIEKIGPSSLTLDIGKLNTSPPDSPLVSKNELLGNKFEVSPRTYLTSYFLHIILILYPLPSIFLSSSGEPTHFTSPSFKTRSLSLKISASSIACVVMIIDFCFLSL